VLVAGPLEFIEGIAVSNPYEKKLRQDPSIDYSAAMSSYQKFGGTLAKRVHDKANKIREKTRVYAEDSMTKSLLEGNFGNALFQTGNALAESAPLILSMYGAAPLGLSKATLGLAGVSSGGLKSLELKEQRLKGDIDISDTMILLNSVLTGGAEMFFEKFTLDAVNASRKVFALGKIKPGDIAEGFIKGLGRSTRIEGMSEGATEFSNAMTDLITGSAEYKGIEELAVRFSDATLVGGIMGGGMHTTPYIFKSLAKFKILDENISTVFTMEDGSKQEMSRAKALKFVKDPEVADQIRRGTINMEASMNDVAKQQLEEIIYGFYAPDAVASREVMFEKEKAVQNILDKVEASEDVSTEELNTLAEATAEMESEGKKSIYNISESTKATRAKSKAILKEKGIEIADATQSQDTSLSDVTETVEVSKIETKEQYDSVKKQIKDKSKNPKVVVSESQKSISVKGENVQKSEVVEGKFKNLNEAKNALKDFEAKRDATKEGEMLESELFPANNKLFIQTKKEALDDIPKEVIDNNDYHVLTSEKEGLTGQERTSRMESLKSMLDEAGATYYTVQGVYNGVAEESLVVTGIDNATALNLGNQFQQESIFSSKDGLMFGDGSITPLNPKNNIKGPGARKMGALSIMSVGGRKMSMHTGLDFSKTSYGKNFNSENVHKLDENHSEYDSELFDGVTEDRKRALGFALKLLNSIGGLNVTIVRNSKAMEGQMQALGLDETVVQSGKRSSFFRGADKTIYVNLETVQGNTLFHEIIHPMVDFIKKSDPELYKKIEAEVSEGKVKRRVMKDGRRMKGSYLDWAKANYEGLSKEGQIEEAFAEMMGDAAYGHFKNKGSRLNRLREVIKAILTKIGVKSFPENVEAIDLATMSLTDLRTDLASALVDGRKITVGGVDFEVLDTDAESRFQLDAIDRRTQVQYTYDVNSEAFSQMESEGLITSGMTIQDFKGKTMMIHSPDATFSGSIIDKDGTILVEGKGGVYYTFKHNEQGYFWASTDNAAKSMVKQLNSMIEANGGKIYMGLTTAREGKLLSNTAMSRGLVNLFTSSNFISKIGLSKPKVYKALIDAANEVDPKGDGLKLGLKPYRASSKFEQSVVEKVWDKLDNKKSKFKDRGLFSDKFLTYVKSSLESGSSKTNFVNFIKTTMGDESLVKFNKKGEPNVGSMKKALVNVLTEPGLRGEEVTDKVYAVLEIDGPVKAIKTDEYESYGTAIVSEKGNRAKIHRLDNKKFWYDVAEDPMTNTVIGETTGESSVGKISSRRSQIMPPMAGVSTTPLKISESIRLQAPTYEMEYTPNSLVSLAMLSDNNRQPEQWVKEIGKGIKGASKDVDTMGLLDLLKAYKKESKAKSIPKEVVAQLIATNMADIETKILANKYLGKEDTYRYPEATLPGGKNYREFLIRDKSPDDIFKAPHFDELGQNLIASVRVDDRVGPNKEKILLVQEIQSDWAQRAADKKKSGEKIGFKKDNLPLTKEEVNEMGDLSATYNRAINEQVKGIKDPWVEDLLFESGGYRVFELLKKVNERISNSKPTEDLKNYQRYLQLQIKDSRFEDAIVDLPWGQTNLWVGLTIRKLINQASKEGYDQIAFVNGEQSDIVQSHTGDMKGTTHKFYNEVVPQNINKELKKLVKGMRYGVTKTNEYQTESQERNLSVETRSRILKLEEALKEARDNNTFNTINAEIDALYGRNQKNAVINLTPELKAATDKVGPLRFQAPQEEGETNVYTSGLASVAFNISEALVNADYAVGGYASQALSSLGLDKGKAYDTRLTSLLAKPFGTHSNEEIKEIMVRSKGNLNVELLRVSENAKKLKEAMKGSDLTSEKVDELLHNMDDIRSMEDSELKFALIDMRMHIDRLSKTLIREGLIEGQTMFTVDANMEVYVRRSYKQFEVKGWEQTDNDIIKKAKDFLYQEAKKDNPDASEERLEEIRDVAFRKLTEEKGILRSLSKSGSLDNLSRVTSIFKEKKAVPQEIRDLWGEIDNPLYNYSNTVSKIARTISAERMYKDLNDIGQGTFISDVQTPDNFNELTGARWGTLEGKFVDEEMFTVMNQVSENLDSGQVQKLYNLYMSTVLLNKKMKTVWNPGTHVKNLIGNTAFAMMNGHIGFRGGMYQDAKTSMQVFKNMKSQDFVELYEKLVGLGVVSSSASLQEIRGIAEDIGNSNFDLSEYLDESNGNIQKLIAKAKRGLGKPIKNLDEKFMKAYQAEDDVWKIFGYLNEKSRYIKAGIDTKTAEELAAKNIINLYPNYNEIPRIIRLIGRSPLIGSFVAFQAESLRNSKNAVVLGFDEISSNNPKIKKIGAARIAGTIATMTLLEGLQLYTAQFLGSMLGFGGDTDDEEVEERKMRLLLPEWDASGNISYMEQGMLESRQFEGQTERDHYFDYINFSSVSGVGYIKDMIRLSFNDIDTKLGEESAMRVLERMYQPFLGDEMTRIVMQDAVSNKGGKIYNSTDSGPTKAMKIAAYVGQKLQPGITRGITRTGEAIFDADSELVPGYEALAFFGLRISRVNVNKGLGIKGNFLYKDMVDRMGKENLKDRFSVIQSAKDNSDFDEELNKMADLMAGARLNGVSGEDIQGILYNSRVSKPVIEEAYIRYFNRYREDIVNVQDN